MPKSRLDFQRLAQTEYGNIQWRDSIDGGGTGKSKRCGSPEVPEVSIWFSIRFF